MMFVEAAARGTLCLCSQACLVVCLVHQGRCSEPTGCPFASGNSRAQGELSIEGAWAFGYCDVGQYAGATSGQ
eukprot:6117324-Alexandrium_andersonii.AAC.1